ncbi:winged helix DNA-binding domain-containing protein [Microlunatus endophyticus]|nr:winged helix DNA-binding domain-containing protein [Microlunatus endophyticus]
MQRISVQQRRAMLARRQRLAGPAPTDVEDLVRSLVCLHATDPASIYLSAWARIPGFARADLDRALYADRTVIKQLAMRRTLFVIDRDDLIDVQPAGAARVAGSESRKMIKMVEEAGVAADGARWLRRASQAVLKALSDGREATSTELAAELPILQGTVRAGSGKWSADVPISPRILTILGAEGRVVRATNRGPWYTSRPRWASMESWLGQSRLNQSWQPADTATAHRRMVQRWLQSFGPGTAMDLKWWLGSTVAAVNRSLAELDPVEVDLDGRPGYLLADDLDQLTDDQPPEPWIALLPALDPTPMGWTDRDWYLGDHKKLVYDTNGNAGPTIWCDGRIVGGWWQDPAGTVIVRLLEEIGSDAAAAVNAEAADLTDWLGGKVVMPRFPSPLAKLVGDQAP